MVIIDEQMAYYLHCCLNCAFIGLLSFLLMQKYRILAQTFFQRSVLNSSIFHSISQQSYGINFVNDKIQQYSYDDLPIKVRPINLIKFYLFRNSKLSILYINSIMRRLIPLLLVFYQALPLYYLAQYQNKSYFSAFVISSANGHIIVDGIFNGSITISHLFNGKYETLQTIQIGDIIFDACFLRDDTILIITNHYFIFYFEKNVDTQLYTSALSVPRSWIFHVNVIPATDLIIQAGSFSSNRLTIYKYVDNSTFPTLYQNLSSIITQSILLFDFSSNSTMITCVDNVNKVMVFKDSGSGFVIVSQFIVANTVKKLKCSPDFQKIFLVMAQTTEVYRWSGSAYVLSKINNNGIVAMSVVQISESQFVFTGDSELVLMKELTSSDQFVQQQRLTAPSSSTVSRVFTDSTGTIIFASSNLYYLVFYDCVLSNCVSCSGIFICGECQQGYSVDATGACIQNPPAVTAVTAPQCNEACLECSPQGCIACPLLSQALQANPSSCQATKEQFSIIAIIVAIFEIVQHYKVKSMLFLVNDLWLYEYHKHNYYGTVHIMFQGAREIQNEKNRLIPFDKLESVQAIKSWLETYESFSNQKYKQIEQQADLIPPNIVNYILQSVPLSLLFYLCVNLLFRATFNYPVSFVFRPFVFLGFLVVALLESNIEFFTFLGFRNMRHLVSKVFSDKALSVFTLFFLYPLILFVISGYSILKHHYGKLFKYFLTNMYRIQGSHQVSAIIFCIRPFLQGIVHSFLYNYNTLQLFLLSLISLFTLVVISGVQIVFSSFKSKVSFIFLQIYFLFGMAMNLFLFLNLKVGKQDELFQVIDTFLQVILLSRVICLILSCFSQILWGFQCLKCQQKGRKQKQIAKATEQSQNTSIRENSRKQIPQSTIDQKIANKKASELVRDKNNKALIRNIFENDNL